MSSRLCAVAILLCTVSPALAEPAVTSSAAVTTATSLSIRIHDYAHVDAEDWQRTEQQISETYARTGVHVQWRLVARPADAEAGRASWPSDAPATITVIVLADGMSGPKGMAADVAGYAPITRERGGRIAFVFAQRTRNIAEQAGVAHEQVLSAVIAHEIAHLLMPGRSHSPDGLMRAHWVPDEFGRTRQQRFSAEEGQAIHDMVGLLAGGGGRIAD
jgi:hypothetical protein